MVHSPGNPALMDPVDRKPVHLSLCCGNPGV